MKHEGLGLFERYLSLWVFGSMLLGTFLGYVADDSLKMIADFSVANVNLPITILIWMMIYPMMLQIDFKSLFHGKKQKKGMWLTLLINWVVKPFTMAIFAFVFFFKIYQAWLLPQEASEYLAGAILLGAAPCTAMVFVWSLLTKGDANYTLVQVAINDLVLLIAFVPIVGFLFRFFDVGGMSDIQIPWPTLIWSVLLFVLLPLLLSQFSNKILRKRKGEAWFQRVFLERLKKLSMWALLLMLVLLFTYQGKTLVEKPFHILLIALPLAIQTYFVFGVTWLLARKMKLPNSISAPASMIAASNFFELAVAVAITVFGIKSGAALATVVGVLIEVPIMLSLVSWVNRQQRKREIGQEVVS